MSGVSLRTKAVASRDLSNIVSSNWNNKLPVVIII
jgi:hypothetical protein